MWALSARWAGWHIRMACRTSARRASKALAEWIRYDGISGVREFERLRRGAGIAKLRLQTRGMLFPVRA